jgi:hypothetical protein
VLGETSCTGEGDGVIVADDLGEGLGLITGPAGTTCCGAMLAFIGSKGRLVKKRARKVANPAAPITLSAIQISSERAVPDLRRPDARDCLRDVSTVNRVREGRRVSATKLPRWMSVPGAQVADYKLSARRSPHAHPAHDLTLMPAPGFDWSIFCASCRVKSVLSMGTFDLNDA